MTTTQVSINKSTVEDMIDLYHMMKKEKEKAIEDFKQIEADLLDHAKENNLDLLEANNPEENLKVINSSSKSYDEKGILQEMTDKNEDLLGAIFKREPVFKKKVFDEMLKADILDSNYDSFVTKKPKKPYLRKA